MANTGAAAAPAPKKKFYFDVKWVIIIAIVLFLLVFEVFPLLYLVYHAFFPAGSFSLEAFQRVYTYKLNWNALRNTMVTASASMIFGVIIAFPLAWLIGRTNLHFKKFFRTLFVMTYMVPPYVGAMAWLRLLNPTVGTLNKFIADILHLSEMPFNIYSVGGLIWVLTTFYYPYAFITISRAMEKMDPSLEEASKISGASPLKTVATITMPMMMPSITICTFLTLTNSFKLYDQNLALTAGRPFLQQGGEVIKTTEMLALNIVNSFYASARSRGVGQAKAVIFFVLVAFLSILQLRSTRNKEVQQ